MIDVFILDKSLKRIEFKNIKKIQGKKLWLDLIDATPEELEAVQKKFDLHPLTIEDMVHRHVRIKIEEFNDYVFIVLYGMETSSGNKLLEGDFIIGKNFVISSHRREVEAHKKLKENPKVLEKLMKKGMDFLMHKLLDESMEATLPVIEKIEDQVEAIETKATKDPSEELAQELLQLKQKILQIRKRTLSQREKIGFLAKNEYPFFTKDIRPYFRDLYDRAIITADATESAKEAAQAAFEAYMSAVNNKMSEVMKVLSIIATIALPLTVISGIWGTNFLNLPGMHSASGFWIMIIVMVLMIGTMFIWFVKKRWL